MSLIPLTPDEPKTHNKILIIVLGVVLGLFVCAIACAGIGGFSVFKLKSSIDQAAQAYSAQVTATHVARATDRASFKFIDTFDDNRNGWFTQDVDDEYFKGNISINDGVYVWNVDQTRKGFIYWGETSRGRENLTDFDAYVDARLAQGDSSGICYGLQFRASIARQMNSYYDFEVCDNGFYRVDYHDGSTETWTTLLHWKKSDAIQSDQWNTLGVSARGADFTFIINDWTVARLHDTRLAAGQVRVYIDSYEGSVGTIWFDNFALAPK
jgi:hypothetical protein